MYLKLYVCHIFQDEFSHKPVVIKVLHTQFYQLGGQESNVLRKLAVADPRNLSHTLRLLVSANVLVKLSTCKDRNGVE